MHNSRIKAPVLRNICLVVCVRVKEILCVLKYAWTATGKHHPLCLLFHISLSRLSNGFNSACSTGLCSLLVEEWARRRTEETLILSTLGRYTTQKQIYRLWRWVWFINMITLQRKIKYQVLIKYCTEQFLTTFIAFKGCLLHYNTEGNTVLLQNIIIYHKCINTTVNKVVYYCFSKCYLFWKM